MDPVSNPYSPGAGRKPAALVGRDQPRRDWQIAIERVESGRTAQPFVLYGLRGVGKTVLLSDFRRSASERDWLVAQVEAGGGKSLSEALGEALYAPLADLARPSAGRRLLKALKTAVIQSVLRPERNLELRFGPGRGLRRRRGHRRPRVSHRPRRDPLSDVGRRLTSRCQKPSDHSPTSGQKRPSHVLSDFDSGNEL